ncbi:cardiolipin synthase [Rhizobacter sp. Root404]|uniref:cardiolipin synthase n=1 Tax=Rhizobacter sp. Root404 TaxID=1736528 RepID=UPI0006F63434|nr:cardiolipin synthase [Rhizobacter sp. Root404]KQW36614.1 cardiolipin synthase [Rhizobacter sp. Root404]
MTRWLPRWMLVASILLLGGCTALPRVVPDMARGSGEPQLQGGRGPLSAARSKQILEGLRAGGKETDVLDRHLALEAAISDSPLVAGNRVALLLDGPATYQAMFAAIEGARDHINMETYILEADEVGQRFAAALIAKQRQGVTVNLIRDSVGTLSTPKEFFKTLTDAGINVVEFNPVNPLTAKAGWEVNQRDHRKLLVVDGQTAFLGGINISSVYSGGSFSQGSKNDRPGNKQPWRDTDLQIDGPVVAELQKMFIATWEKQKGKPLAPRNYFPKLTRQGSEVVHALGGSPDEPYSVIYATLISAIDSAETEILLTNAYFVPDPQLIASLKGAVARGVDVKIVLPGATDSALVFHAGRSYYDELLAGGIKIYERQNALLHAKTALIDGVWSTVGSTNLDWRSFLHNQEVNAVVLGKEFGQRMRAAFDDDLAQSKQITLEQWQRRSPLERAKETFGRIWQYWL